MELKDIIRTLIEAKRNGNSASEMRNVYKLNGYENTHYWQLIEEAIKIVYGSK